VQDQTRRLAEGERRPWPETPVPVALVITDLDVGGAERMLVALATRLDRRRWRPSVICLDRAGPLAEALRGAGLEIDCLAVSPRRPLRALARLARALRRRAPRLVQSFLFHANVASRLAAPLAAFPGPVPWVVGGLRVAEHQKRWHRTLDRLTARLSAGAVCVSRGVERFSREVVGIAPDRLTVIVNGVDLAPLDRAEPLPRGALGVPDGAHLALSIGRLDVQKGLPDLLDAAGWVIARRPDWHLVLVGDGPERAWLLARIAARPALAGRVHWLGRRGDVPALLVAADVLVLASLWEGMPNVVLEAMAARRAVVATAVEGSEDLVTPGQTGWLVPPRDPSALGRALLEAAGDPDRCRRYGAAGRARVEAEFSLDRMVNAYERLWAGLLGLRWEP
jgi:glycosyltransferase involved in cell wall biosynthesis